MENMLQTSWDLDSSFKRIDSISAHQRCFLEQFGITSFRHVRLPTQYKTLAMPSRCPACQDGLQLG